MAKDHRGNPLHAGKRTNDEMMSMPTPGVALSYWTPNKEDIVLTDHGAYTGEGYVEHFGNPDTGQLYPSPMKHDFDDSPKPQKSKGVSKKKAPSTKEQKANRDLFW